MNAILESIDKFSDKPYIRDIESVVFFLAVVFGVIMLNKWLSRKEPEEAQETDNRVRK